MLLAVLLLSMAAASSSASQPTEQVNASQLDVTELWARIQRFGRFPKRKRNPQSEAEHEEQALWNFLYKSKNKGIPDDIWQKMREYGADQPVDAAQSLTDEILRFGSYPKPKKIRGDYGNALYQKMTKAMEKNIFSAAQKYDIESLPGGTPAFDNTGEKIIDEVRALGYYPRESKTNLVESILAQKLRKAFKGGVFQPAELTELEDLRKRSVHPIDMARSAQLIEEAEQEPDPTEGFSDVARNRLEQDLLILASGQSTRLLQRRLKQYKDFVNNKATQSTDFTTQYAERILEAIANSTAGPATYVPGDEIVGDELRTFSDKPVISGPLVCQLCEADFTNEKDFCRHKASDHAGETEYRKRVLYLMAEAGPRPITAQEKRIIVQNFARFQQYCRPGAKGNFFADCEELPRCEAACAICAQKDYLEHRHKISLFGEAPSSCISEAHIHNDAEEQDQDSNEMGRNHQPIAYSMVKQHGVYYIQSPEQMQAFMNVERYMERWPLIPPEHLHASSVQHPQHPEWRWLLHTRRVPLVENADVTQLGVQDSTGDRPPCAGIGDPTGIVWACWDCLQDVCSKRPMIPLNACANDNWIGRERTNVRAATVATKTLLSLGRACWKQVRLGRGKPDVQQKGVCGNTIFFAQPTADIPSMELPPPTDALVDSFNVIITRKLDDLRYATWATVNREDYMTMARQRKAECPIFAHVTLRDDLATTRLPEDGIPEHIRNCVQHVHGADKAPIRMSGPASRAPELSKDDEAGEESDRSDSADDEDQRVGAAQPDVECAYDNVAESTIALDPLHDVAPVRMMQALRGTIEAVSAHAAQIAQNERKAQITDNDGVLQPVADEGGRHLMKSMVHAIDHGSLCCHVIST